MEWSSELISILENVEWPITKGQLLKYAIDNDISPDLIKEIRELEVDDGFYFHSIDDIFDDDNVYDDTDDDEDDDDYE